MDFGNLIFYAVCTFVLIVWLSLLASAGHVLSVGADGFEVRSLLRRRRFVEWGDVGEPIKLYSEFLPRVVIPTKRPTFFSTNRSFIVFLRAGDLDMQYLEQLRTRFEIKAPGHLGF